jgi:hypothetical protein
MASTKKFRSANLPSLLSFGKDQAEKETPHPTSIDFGIEKTSRQIKRGKVGTTRHENPIR